MFVILCMFLAVFHFKESNLMMPHQLDQVIPEVLPHDCSNAAPPDKTYKFIAFITKMRYIDDGIECLPHGTAAVVTNIHALISATLLDDYRSEKIRKLALLVGGFGPCSNYVGKRAHAILDAKPHPDYAPYQDPPSADIAVVFLKTAIDMVQDGASTIPLSLEDVKNNILVTQLGWVEKDFDPYCEQGFLCWNLARRRFQVTLIDGENFFKSRNNLHALEGDHGGPVLVSNAGQFELVGLTSQNSTKRSAAYTKIYNFLPFIATQLKIDKNPGERDPPYDPMLWIKPLLASRFADCPPNTIINSNATPTNDEESERLPHDCDVAAPSDKTYPFLAFLVINDLTDDHVNCTPLGIAAIVTEIHAVITASTIHNYNQKKLEKMCLVVGGFGPCEEVCRHDYNILFARPHYKYSPSSKVPFADIAVLFLERRIDFLHEGASPIKLGLQDVEQNLPVIQLGWVKIECDFERVQNWWCWDPARRYFRVSLLENKQLFEGDTKYKMKEGDRGGLIVTEREGGFELVGFATKPSSSGIPTYTKVVNFAPFFAEQLQIDVAGANYRFTPYVPSDWISYLLHSRLVQCPPDTILY